MPAFDDVLSTATQLDLRDQIKLLKALHETTRVGLDVQWSEPVTFQQAKSLPAAAGVYVIFLDDGQKKSMVRIGAARNLSHRPAEYVATPFDLEPRLRIVCSTIPDAFRQAMSTLIEEGYAEHKEDLDWLEYRMERKLLDDYEERWNGLPPANFQRGSARIYMDHIAVNETGPFNVLGLPPAELAEEVRVGLRQSRK